MNILSYAFVGGSGAEPPEAREISRIVLENPMETIIFLKYFMNSERILFISNAIFI